jgi:hypothetical protein
MGSEVANHVDYIKTPADYEQKVEASKLNKLIVRKLIYA